MRGRIVTFWLFGVFIGCLPILFTLSHATTHPKSGLSLTSVLGAGSLLLVSVAVGAPAVGGLFARTTGELARVVGGLTLVSVLLAAYGYADGSTAGSSPHSVAIESLVFFGLISFLGTACTALSERTRG